MAKGNEDEPKVLDIGSYRNRVIFAWEVARALLESTDPKMEYKDGNQAIGRSEFWAAMASIVRRELAPQGEREFDAFLAFLFIRNIELTSYALAECDRNGEDQQ